MGISLKSKLHGCRNDDGWTSWTAKPFFNIGQDCTEWLEVEREHEGADMEQLEIPTSPPRTMCLDRNQCAVPGKVQSGEELW